MRKWWMMQWILRGALGLFFIWSGVMKLGDLGAFTQSVANFQFPLEQRIPWGMARFFEQPADAIIAYALPWLEIFSGLALFITRFKTAGAVTLGGLLLSFNLALWSAWDRGIKDLNCGCHGASDTPTDFGAKIASNFALVGVIFVILVMVAVLRRKGHAPVT